MRLLISGEEQAPPQMDRMTEEELLRRAATRIGPTGSQPAQHQKLTQNRKKVSKAHTRTTRYQAGADCGGAKALRISFSSRRC